MLCIVWSPNLWSSLVILGHHPWSSVVDSKPTKLSDLFKDEGHQKQANVKKVRYRS